jgi:hypothetical protein
MGRASGWSLTMSRSTFRECLTRPIKRGGGHFVNWRTCPRANLNGGGVAQTTRGTGADVIIVDEAAHIDPKLFFKTIVPILSMANTSLLCLSSPEGDSNYYSQLMNLKRPDQTPFFNVVNCFQICQKCLKMERVKQIECTHVKSTAHWLSSRKIRELKTLYKAWGILGGESSWGFLTQKNQANPEDAIREFGGVVVSDHLPAFRKEDVRNIMELDVVRTQVTPQYIFTCCDPTGGGPSMLSIASGYYDRNGDVVVRFTLSHTRARRRAKIAVSRV